MLAKTGIVPLEAVETALPSRERRNKGAYAIFECFQEIPCNPCFTSCKPGAVEPFADINHVPKINHEKCTGCAQCVSVCPGLACFVIDETYAEQEAAVKLPYEFLPLPEVGQEVEALDRQGNVVGKARVIKVQNNKNLDSTNVITLAVPKEQLLFVRNIRLGGAS